MIVILSFIAVGSLRSTRVAVNLEQAFSERAADIYAAKNACLFALSKVEIGDEVAGDAAGVAGADKGDGVLDLKKAWAPRSEPYPISIGDIACDVYIDDESGKFNVNTVSDDNKNLFVEFLISKDVKREVTRIITDSVIDWKDKDDLHHPDGAEDSYYESLPDPYKTKDAPFDSVEELRLVKGVTSFIYDEISNDVTVFGSGKINLNFAGKDVLMAIPGVDSAIAGELLAFIDENGSFRDEEQLREFFFGLGIAGASFEDFRKYVTLDVDNFVTIRSVCSISGGDDLAARSHQYRIVAEVGAKERKILAVYPD